MENQEQNNIPMPSNAKILGLVIIFSLIFGGLSGTVSSFYFLKSPQGQKLLAGQNILSSQGQKISLDEDSAIIDVVKKSKDAVVSIVISKDLSKISGYGMSPFGGDPFFNFFNEGQSQPQTNQSTPNVQEVGAGSGFFVSADGLIITNKHVVADDSASYTVITQDGKKYDAKVLTKDPVGDLAIVKVDIKNAPFLKFADSSKIQIGQRAIAIGNSLGQYQNTVTSGIISGIGRKITAGSQDGSEELSGVIQTDTAINPGNSGGPLLNISGEVVGVNTAIDQQGQLVGFAIPANDVNKDLISFLKNGRITRVFLGVRYVTLNQSIADEQKLPKNYGALIVRGQNITDLAVLPGSPADKVGLVENDIILEVNGQKVDQDHLLSDMLKNMNIGDKITLKIYHKGDEKNVDVVLGESK